MRGKTILLAVAISSIAAFTATLPANAGPLPPGGTFIDDDGNVHEGNIEAIAAEGITQGCTVDLFCPADLVTREQMAAFLNRSLGLAPTSVDFFGDDEASIFEDDINRLAAAGITTGCSPDAFCPRVAVSRAQMAGFLVRAYGWTDDGGGNHFNDDDGNFFEPQIDILATAGVTLGCGPGAFCPHDSVRRDQMASFLARAGGLVPMVPPPRCTVLPANNIWNTPISGAPTHTRSAEYISSIGAADTLHPDFGAGVWPLGSDSPIGIPFVEVNASQPLVDITYTAYGDESDPGPMPIPANAPIEGGPSGAGDRHVIVLNTDTCMLYELFSSYPQADGSWEAASGATYDLRSNALRPDGWTSADAAGLPIYPGLVRYEDVAGGRIEHAIRFTASQTQRAYVWPARHFASSITDQSVPPMGQRFRMKASYDISGFSAEIQVILTAFKEFGLILADNGSDWFISGAPDDRWDNDMLRELKDIPGSAFEAVDVSSWMVHPDSGQATP